MLEKLFIERQVVGAINELNRVQRLVFTDQFSEAISEIEIYGGNGN